MSIADFAPIRLWLYGPPYSDGMCICGHRAEAHDSGAHEEGVPHWGGCESRTCPCDHYEWDESAYYYTLVERIVEEWIEATPYEKFVEHQEAEMEATGEVNPFSLPFSDPGHR